ncbi:uncharacterized protein [Desmodus rotundus]|uniref:uncharacterized protein isoform X3 n=1 Tax=Desmodus rotundus TaxID=9430 RepID=UPI0039E55818
MAAAAGWFGGVAEALSPLLAKPPFSFVTRRGGARAGEAAAGVEGAQERVAACKSGECACASHRSFVRCHDQRKDSQFYQMRQEFERTLTRELKEDLTGYGAGIRTKASTSSYSNAVKGPCWEKQSD